MSVHLNSLEAYTGYRLFERVANLVLRFGEYRQILHDLDSGKLDLVLTPQRGQQTNLEYIPFTKERIVLICGSETDTKQFDELVLANDRPAIRHWLKAQIWYATAADMEHLQRFWIANFDCLPDLMLRASFLSPEKRIWL